uniref:Uncharacterized protein n=1 Tax=Globisporangium ultimum (strain ATCC 200006 / CBS 805.95 / DAOM BR144) TaxID=431595 RepID=K3WK27_GLOUD
MRPRLLSALLALIAVVVTGSKVVQAELNECLGVEISQLQAIPTCKTLFTACEIGVSKLNQQLHTTPELRFNPVSVISASQSKANTTDNTLIAMLVQLAPITECVEASKDVAKMRGTKTSCTFDMSKVEIYSILMTLDAVHSWSLDAFKHHALAADERAKIVKQYEKGKFYGTNLAIGIFDTPNMPLDSVSNSQDKTFTRSPMGIFVVLGSAVVSIGLLFHHRRRLSNGYAPIVIVKSGRQLQNRPAPSTKPQLASLRHPNPVPVNEETTIKHEQSERFAV